MKTTALILKIVAIILVVATTVCTIVAYWDKLSALGKSLYSKVRATCELGRDDFSDYAE